MNPDLSGVISGQNREKNTGFPLGVGNDKKALVILSTENIHAPFVPLVASPPVLLQAIENTGSKSRQVGMAPENYGWMERWIPVKLRITSNYKYHIKGRSRAQLFLPIFLYSSASFAPLR